jgi:hypothetical protein
MTTTTTKGTLMHVTTDWEVTTTYTFDRPTVEVLSWVEGRTAKYPHGISKVVVTWYSENPEDPDADTAIVRFSARPLRKDGGFSMRSSAITYIPEKGERETLLARLGIALSPPLVEAAP